MNYGTGCSAPIRIQPRTACEIVSCLSSTVSPGASVKRGLREESVSLLTFSYVLSTSAAQM